MRAVRDRGGGANDGKTRRADRQNQKPHRDRRCVKSASLRTYGLQDRLEYRSMTTVGQRTERRSRCGTEKISAGKNERQSDGTESNDTSIVDEDFTGKTIFQSSSSGSSKLIALPVLQHATKPQSLDRARPKSPTSKLGKRLPVYAPIEQGRWLKHFKNKHRYVNENSDRITRRANGSLFYRSVDVLVNGNSGGRMFGC